jgi:predicted phosphodiesterase
LKNKNFQVSVEDKNLLRTINKHGISAIELDNLLSAKKPPRKFYDHSTIGKLKIGIISDMHIGSNYFDEELFAWAGEIFRKEKITSVYCPGDIVEGTNKRNGAVFELSHIGFSKQINYAAELINKYFKGLKLYSIIGNHDLWYVKQANGGANVGEALQDKLGIFKFEYLGINNATIKLGPRTTMLLHHAGDGSAYATSYKMQKLVESLESGNKPSIIVEGHYHKSLYMFCRNIHCIEAGTMQGQTDFMRGKKLAAHKGFWILDMSLGKSGIISFSPTWYPCYE